VQATTLQYHRENEWPRLISKVDFMISFENGFGGKSSAARHFAVPLILSEKNQSPGKIKAGQERGEIGQG
jgi:hypothetical protein